MSAIALDPLIAEAKRRARRRRVLGIGVAVVAALAAALTLSSLRSPRAVTDSNPSLSYRQVNVDEFGSSGGVTWAWSPVGVSMSEKLRFTSDDGKTWRTTVLPRQVLSDDIIQVDFSDRQHGWLVLDGPDAGFSRHMWGQVFRSTDGGRTWSRSLPPGCHPGCGIPSITFPSPSRGYLLDGRPRGRGRLWTTADGGTTWRLVSRPPLPWPHSMIESQISFLNERVGFALTGKRGKVRGLARTDDGGRTWKRVPLVPGDLTGSIAYGINGSTDMPWMRGSDVVAGTLRHVPGRRGLQLVVNVSRDRGATWRARTTPWVFASYPAFDVVTPRRWVVRDYDQPRRHRWLTYVTTDAGQSWSRLKGPVERAEIRGSGIRLAWGIDGYTLVRTTDGGVHWQPAGPSVPRRQPKRRS